MAVNGVGDENIIWNDKTGESIMSLGNCFEVERWASEPTAQERSSSSRLSSIQKSLRGDASDSE